MRSPAARRPNVLIVVLDCVRSSDLFGPGSVDDALPFLTGLRRESVNFQRAVSPAPWTLPAHAALFSGLYPWEHGTHARASLEMPVTVPRISEALRDHDYATFLLSANPILEPAFNFVQGFDRARWGQWWEPFLRIPRSTGRPSGVGTQRSGGPKLHRGDWGDRLLHRAMHQGLHFSAVLDWTRQLAQGVRRPEPGLELAVAHWIEPTLSEWMSDTPARTPVFAFVNLVEAHEPYFSNPEVTRTVGDRIRLARCRQDFVGVFNGEWRPDPARMALLHQLYRAQLRVIDRRLARLISALKSAGRWESTLLIVTSDHGQAFGEHGMLFHMIRPDESLLRVPLLVRFPDRELRGDVDHWASLVDIVPTVLRATGLPAPTYSPGVALQELAEHERPGPVLAACDGLVWGHNRSQVSPARLAELDATFGVAYEGDWKVVVRRPGREIRAYHLASDPGETRDRWDSGDPMLARLGARAAEAADGLSRTKPTPSSPDVEARLRSWGYL